MMIGETHRHHHHGPPWPEPTSPTQTAYSNLLSTSPLAEQPTSYAAVLASLRQYVLSAAAGAEQKSPAPAELPADDIDFPPEDDDEFFMYDFKVRKCTRARAHDWTECPFAHPGEKARRRDPRKYSYSGTACSDFRKGGCKKGDGCEFAHGVFECWLHPARYRTQACKDGPGCRRRVCFFAHTTDQIRAGSGLANSPRSPHSNATEFGDDGLMSSSIGSIGSGSIAELAASLRNLQLNKVKSMPSSWAGGGVQIGSPVFGSPRAGSGTVTCPGFFSLPTTPTRPWNGLWDSKKDCCGGGEEEPVMERVESGRELRARMFEKLSKENPLNGPSLAEIPVPGPDFGWVADLIT